MEEQETQAEDQRQVLTDQFRRPERNLWKDAFTQLIANRLAMGSIVIIFIVFFIAAFGPYLTPYDHLYQDWDNIAQPPPGCIRWARTNSDAICFLVSWRAGARLSWLRWSPQRWPLSWAS